MLLVVRQEKNGHCKNYIKVRKDDEVGDIATRNEQAYWVIVSVW